MAHIHEQIDWTVAVFIVHGDKVLLRMHEKYHLWLGVGGHIELDEDPLQAAHRECMEEVGLDIKVHGEDQLTFYEEDRLQELPRPASMNIHKVNETHQHIDVIYYATCEHTNIVPENPTDTWQWLTKEELEQQDDILESVKIRALEALQTFSS